MHVYIFIYTYREESANRCLQRHRRQAQGATSGCFQESASLQFRVVN